MKNIFTTVSAIALAVVISAPAHAADESTRVRTETRVTESNPDHVETNTVTKEEVKKGWEDTKEAVKEAYEDVKYTLLGEKPGISPVIIDSRVTADGMIGKPMRNINNDEVAVLHDLILDKDGNVQMAVVSDADFIAAGSKQAAFDYSLVTAVDKDGDIITPISEKNIELARTFSYDKNDAGKEGIRVIPQGGYSAKDLLNAEVLDSQGRKAADVDNISLKGGKANMLIIGYHKVMGMGGDSAALAFSDVKLVRNKNDSLSFQLTATQSDQFETFKKAMTN